MAGFAQRARSVGDADTARTHKYRKSQQPPPLKRRRLVHNSSTATSESASGASSGSESDSSASSSESSDEHDNVNDEDYVHTNTEEDDTVAASKPSYHRRQAFRDSFASASTSDSSSEGSSRAPLSSIETNRPRRADRKRSSLQKGKDVAGKRLRRSQPVDLPRFAPSPVKLLPAQQRYSGGQPTRGFQVRPDIPFGNAGNSGLAQSPRRVTTRASIQAGFRKMAGRVMAKVNNMGISGNASQGRSARVTGSTSSTSLSGKRKREEQAKPSAHRRSMYEFGSLNQAAVASLQPLRRTRSIARQIEQLGVPLSEAHESSADSADEVDEQSAAHDSETESVERSIAEMSLDEISEQNEDDETGPEASDLAEDPEDSFYLQEASLAQLNRLRKDKLVHLANLLRLDDSEILDDSTKDTLIKTILETRSSGCDSDEAESHSHRHDASATSDEDDSTIHTVTSSSQNSRTHLRRGSTLSRSQTASASLRQSPRHSPRTRRSLNRTRSNPQSEPESDASTSSDEEQASSPRARSKTSSVNLRSGSSGIGMGRPGALAERTPGRLRSGKLRNSISSMPSNSDGDAGDEEDEDDGDAESNDADPALLEEDEDDLPTPIARRTRHYRHRSIASASSAGMEEEEADNALPNHEYRLRKVSLPRQAKGKRSSIVEVSDEESEEDDEDTPEQRETIVEESEAAEDVDDDEVDELDHSVDFDLTDATESSLLKLRKDDLIQLCAVRDLSTEGTKPRLAEALLEWQRQQEEANSGTGKAAAEDEDEDEEDESFQLEADTSMISNQSCDSEDSASSTDTERASVKRAREETKTQALAKVSNKRQSYDHATQQKPLLLGKHSQHKHTPKIDTPPGSGDKQDNDLELDLESLNLLDKEIAPDKIKRGEKIGSGGFKDVYEGKYRNVKVAIADIRGHLTENDLKELGLLRDLRHTNVVRFIGVSIPTERNVPVSIITELCSNGDLFDYVRNRPPPAFDKILSIMLDIAKGLDYLHKRKPATIHRDMKSSNVLITAKGVAKIADFGLARVRNSTRSIIKSLVGTVNWQAPELWVAHPRYNEKVDVYSAAMVFWECLQWHLPTKRYPFEGMNEHAIYQEVGQKQLRPSTATMRRQWGGDILDVVDRMWAQDPKQRPDMSEVVEDLEDMIQAEKARVRAARQ